jgi:hypothetical protein
VYTVFVEIPLWLDIITEDQHFSLFLVPARLAVSTCAGIFGICEQLKIWTRNFDIYRKERTRFPSLALEFVRGGIYGNYPLFVLYKYFLELGKSQEDDPDGYFDGFLPKSMQHS